MEINSTQVMSKIIHYTKYAKYLNDESRREDWKESAYRNRDMHIKKYPFLREEITKVYDEFVLPKYVLPSMRSMQFAGLPIELNETRIYNCSYLPIDDHRAFQEVMFLLLGGTGVGYSVQTRHVEKLPSIRKPTRQKKFVISDNIIGWSDAVGALVKAYLDGGSLPKFEFRDIRKKGTLLKTSGGKAPGPEQLKITLKKIQDIFESKTNGSRLSPLDCHDICCHIADVVLSGGIRRAAMICLFNMDDDEMIRCKSNFRIKILDEGPVGDNRWQLSVETTWSEKTHIVYVGKEHYEMAKKESHLPWWFFEPQRGRANNSAVFVRYKANEESFNNLWTKVVNSNAGEPGIYFTNNPDWGTNPCVETALRPYQFCNLNEIDASTVKSKEDLIAKAKAAAFIGTLQAGWTDFHYLRDVWIDNTQKDALLGVSMTGLASVNLPEEWLEEAAEAVKSENKRVASIIGINPSARTTCVKPSGTTSLILGTSSGCHGWYDKFYVRRIQVNKLEPIYSYLKGKIPQLLEDSYFAPQQDAFICIPMKAPEGAVIAKEEGAIDMLERVKKLNVHWVRKGHNKGDNSHNVSATVYVKPEEWDAVGEWMWSNRETFNGLAVLPFDGGTYFQAPHETITEEKYNEMVKYLADIDLTEIVEGEDNTKKSEELACAGGFCELP